MILTPADAASKAWLAVLRRGHGTRATADALVEAFDCAGLSTERTQWQGVIDRLALVDGFGPFCASAVSRFDLNPPKRDTET